MYYKALADIDSQYTKIFKGNLKPNSNIRDIENDIAKKASKTFNVNNVSIIELITAGSNKELKEKCERF
ncbi:hypothetical protein N9014_00720 [bacterium]|nr:hypothetical protein [bacterium]|tara:strand:+ start:499 stop:705 length:207 start_codon:yes stop_codon:yes gene_type:complete